MQSNKNLRVCIDAIDSCFRQIECELEDLVSRNEYSLVGRLADALSDLKHVRSRFQGATPESHISSSRVEVEQTRSVTSVPSVQDKFSAELTIAEGKKCYFVCSEHELIKVGRTKEGGEYRHRVLWSQVVRALRQFAQIDSREWRVSQVCEYSNQDQQNVPLTETHVYLTLGLLNAYSTQIIGTGSQRGHYTVLNPAFLMNMADRIEKSSSAEEISNWLASSQPVSSKVGS